MDYARNKNEAEAFVENGLSKEILRNKKGDSNPSFEIPFCAPTRARTRHPLIMSQML